MRLTIELQHDANFPCPLEIDRLGIAHIKLLTPAHILSAKIPLLIENKFEFSIDAHEAPVEGNSADSNVSLQQILDIPESELEKIFQMTPEKAIEMLEILKKAVTTQIDRLRAPALEKAGDQKASEIQYALDCLIEGIYIKYRIERPLTDRSLISLDHTQIQSIHFYLHSFETMLDAQFRTWEKGSFIDKQSLKKALNISRPSKSWINLGTLLSNANALTAVNTGLQSYEKKTQ